MGAADAIESALIGTVAKVGECVIGGMPPNAGRPPLVGLLGVVRVRARLNIEGIPVSTHLGVWKTVSGKA